MITTVKSAKAARVMLPGGEIRQFREPVKAAELMLESPNFFLVNSKSLTMGRRFSPLSADEDLEFGNLYLMFPMKKVNSVVTAADISVFLMAANTAPKRIAGGNIIRISPEVLAQPAVSGDNPSENETGRSGFNLEVVEGFPTAEYKYRHSVCRSRKPLLDTITEEPVSAR
ncbi:unnamed protein product [Fraxinus pennsylvanica]|uniref:Uncharacterized protein n=1 Tax=Fraxinus pennsylvanica TaxID=56036 RepID=A0AAD2AC42_9LAMI|nr:unnamed protein product [Fraxinus pennsylvanica]